MKNEKASSTRDHIDSLVKYARGNKILAAIIVISSLAAIAATTIDAAKKLGLFALELFQDAPRLKVGFAVFSNEIFYRWRSQDQILLSHVVRSIESPGCAELVWETELPKAPDKIVELEDGPGSSHVAMKVLVENPTGRRYTNVQLTIGPIGPFDFKEIFYTPGVSATLYRPTIPNTVSPYIIQIKSLDPKSKAIITLRQTMDSAAVSAFTTPGNFPISVLSTSMDNNDTPIIVHINEFPIARELLELEGFLLTGKHQFVSSVKIAVRPSSEGLKYARHKAMLPHTTMCAQKTKAK